MNRLQRHGIAHVAPQRRARRVNRARHGATPVIEIHNHIAAPHTTVDVPAPTIVVRERPVRNVELIHDAQGRTTGAKITDERAAE
jgi:hypothetical protein